MSSICILTDNSAQFPRPSFPGMEIINVIDLNVSLYGDLQNNGSSMKPHNLPRTADASLKPQLLPPTVQDFQRFFVQLGKSYNVILGVFLSSSINDCFFNAKKAADSLRNSVNIQLIDSQTTSIGLGLLVQTIAEAIHDGASSSMVDRMARNMIKHTYTVVTVPGLSYLESNGFVDFTQSTITEMLELFPLFSFEDGVLTPLEKVKSHRQSTLFFQEFIDEFIALQHIALLQSSPPNQQEARMLREFVQESYPDTPFSEHAFNLPLATLFGPNSMGLIVVESNH
ncbi:MAG: DegV family EDD domain-containing protein [Anaerolineaceae bacterium]|nr:DegV family EDD domain-containing protein [Anaerolineaceae bacterium]